MIENNFSNNFNSNLIDTVAELDSNDNITPQIVSNNSSLSLSSFNTIIGETGSATLNNNLKEISFENEYDNPVVLATSLSSNSSDPASVRITDVSGSNFTAFVEQPNYLAPANQVQESFSYIVIEAGNYMLSDGTLIEANTGESNATTYTRWESVEFDSNFDSAPVVFSQVQSNNGPDFVRTRMHDIDADGFIVSMEEEEKLLPSGHATETIGFLAISEGSGTWGNSLYQVGRTESEVTESNHILQLDDFDRAPNFMADIATYHGTDSVGVRHERLSNDRISIMLEEDSSLDVERYHESEVVNFLAIESNGLLTGAAIDPTELLPIQVTAFDPGEQLYTGQMAKITWDMNIIEQDEDENALFDIGQSVDIGIYLGEDLVHRIADNARHDGETYWIIPTDLASNLYTLRISESIPALGPRPVGDEITTLNTGRRFGAEISIGIGSERGNGNIFDGNSGDVNIGLNNDFDSDGESDFDDRFSFSGDRVFDANYYLRQNPDVAEAGVNPQRHYVEFGFKEGRDPNKIFDTSFYLEQYPDVALAGVNPLAHYYEFRDTDEIRRFPNKVNQSFGITEGALVASTDLSGIDYEEFKNTVRENETALLPALAVPFIIIEGTKILAITAASVGTIIAANNIRELLEESDTEVFVPEDVDTSIPPFDLGETTRIADLNNIPRGEDFLENIINGNFEFPDTDAEGVGSYFLPIETQTGPPGYIDLEKTRTITSERKTHILDGEPDGKSGGHRAGTGNPGKTEFPKKWSDDEIIENIDKVLEDPNSTWTRQTGKTGSSFTKNGDPATWKVEGTIGGIDIRVIVEPVGRGVVSGFPTNTPPNPLP